MGRAKRSSLLVPFHWFTKFKTRGALMQLPSVNGSVLTWAVPGRSAESSGRSSAQTDDTPAAANRSPRRAASPPTGRGPSSSRTPRPRPPGRNPGAPRGRACGTPLWFYCRTPWPSRWKRKPGNQPEHQHPDLSPADRQIGSVSKLVDVLWEVGREIMDVFGKQTWKSNSSDSCPLQTSVRCAGGQLEGKKPSSSQALLATSSSSACLATTRKRSRKFMRPPSDSSCIFFFENLE